MSINKKILVVLPLSGGSLPVGENCIDAFKKLGHTVEIFHGASYLEAYSAIRKTNINLQVRAQIENNFLQVIGQVLSSQIDTFAPDILFTVAQAPVSPIVLDKCKKQNIKTIMWFVEDYKIFTYWKAFAPLYDYFAVIQKEPFLSLLAQVGQNNAFYLPLAANPHLHKEQTLSNDEKEHYGSAISFMGAGYANRQKAFLELVPYGLKIWGTEWDGANEKLLARLQDNGKRLNPKEYIKIFTATDININLHSSVQDDELITEDDFVNPRTFELASCGAFQLVDKRKYLSEMFTDGEIATFSSMQELHEKIRYYLENPSEAKQIAQKGQLRVLKEHTYQKRMAQLLTIINDNKEEEEKKKSSFWDAERKKELVDLLEKLHLNENADIESIFKAISLNKEDLSSYKTALSYINEWGKNRNL